MFEICCISSSALGGRLGGGRLTSDARLCDGGTVTLLDATAAGLKAKPGGGAGGGGGPPGTTGRKPCTSSLTSGGIGRT